MEQATKEQRCCEFIIKLFEKRDELALQAKHELETYNMTQSKVNILSAMLTYSICEEIGKGLR